MLARRPGGLTLGAVAVGRVLLDLLGQDGRLDLCIDTLAWLARVHTATVVGRWRSSGRPASSLGPGASHAMAGAQCRCRTPMHCR
jgi:hypothetical protein